MSDLYNDLYADLEPKRFSKSGPMPVEKLEFGMAFEEMLEDSLRKRLVGERPGEFTTEEGIIYSPDLLIFNGATRLGEIKLTWMSCREMPKERTDAGLPSKFAKWDCVAPHTMILDANLRYRPAGDLCVGDELFAFDEETPHVGRRHFRRTVVRRIKHLMKPSVMLHVGGSTLECSADHLWLAATPAQSMTWLRADQLLQVDKRGGKGGRPSAQACSLAQVAPARYTTLLSDVERGWLAGIFDGEGCLVRRNEGPFRLVVSQRPGAVLDQIITLLTLDGFRFTTAKGNGGELGQGDTVSLNLDYTADIYRFLAVVRPWRLWAKFATHSRLTDFRYDRVVVQAREDIGLRPVVAIETDSHTFVAEGFASHNCQMRCYCHHLETPYARLIGCFVNGDYNHYKCGDPQVLGWDIEYTARELKENWAMVRNHALHKGIL